jgi:hypothetical protein
MYNAKKNYKLESIIKLIKMNEANIYEFLNSWKDGVIGIGSVFKSDGDYKKEATSFIDKHYAFNESNVLFKPTFTKQVIFRNNKEDALSYFIKGDIIEDNGFAIKPWKSIEPLEIHINIEDNFSIAMGVLELSPFSDENPTKIAFTFILDEFDNGIKIKAHHSSPIIS